MGSLELLSYFWSLNTIWVVKFGNFDFDGLSHPPQVIGQIKCRQYQHWKLRNPILGLPLMCHVICNLALDQDEDDGNDRFGIAINVYFEVWHGNDRMAINLQCDMFGVQWYFRITPHQTRGCWILVIWHQYHLHPNHRDHEIQGFGIGHKKQEGGLGWPKVA